MKYKKGDKIKWLDEKDVSYILGIMENKYFLQHDDMSSGWMDTDWVDLNTTLYKEDMSHPYTDIFK